MNTSVKYGLTGGLFYIIMQMCVYLIDPTLLFSWSNVILFLILLVIIFVVCSVYAIRTKRNGLGGFITFKAAFKEAFITAVVISVLLNVFNYLLYAVIDPTLEDQLREFVMSSTAQFMESVPDEQFEEVMGELENKDFVSIMGTFWGIVQFILYGAIIGAITSAVMKKEDPEEAYRIANEKEDTIDL